MKTIFAISTGEYSDYSVLAACEDEATANEWVAALKAGDEEGTWSSYRDARVESLRLIAPGEKPIKETQYSQAVELWDDGTIKQSEIRAHTDYPICSYVGDVPTRPVVRYVRAPCHNNRGGRLEVRAATAETVGKVVSEKIAMWKAGVWGGPAHKEINED